MLVLGGLVAVSFLTVLIATSAALSYTRYSILSDEKKHLLETARALAREYSDKADFAHRINEVPLSKIRPWNLPMASLLSSAGLCCRMQRESKAVLRAHYKHAAGIFLSDP